MERRARRVFRGYLELSNFERKEFEDAVEEFRRGSESTRKDLRTNVEREVRMDTGPVGTGCPCCGR